MAISSLSCEAFRQRNRIDEAKWQAAGIEWTALLSIAEDLERRTGELSELAAYHARLLQRCPAVHSVRWRLKDPEHLMEKIVRKRAQGSEKYADIAVDNYLTTVTDLIGLRALHLFKSEWEAVHVFLSQNWNHHEPPVAYVRDGDSEEIRAAYSGAACCVETHPAGYRSVHYVVSSRPQKDEILSEVQVRTIFEEGWSEIDHRVRYPNFSDNELVALFLATFNRIAGSADEMGSFVRALAGAMATYEQDTKQARADLENHVSRIEQLVRELNEQKEKGAAQNRRLEELTAEVSGLRASANRPRQLNIAGMNVYGPTSNLLKLTNELNSFGLSRTRNSVSLPELDEATRIFRLLGGESASTTHKNAVLVARATGAPPRKAGSDEDP